MNNVYVEPKEYFTEEMKKILNGEKEETKEPKDKKDVAKVKTEKEDEK